MSIETNATNLVENVCRYWYLIGSNVKQLNQSGIFY